MADLLAGLGNDYQVLTELTRARGAITYLARHLTLARDVTITVVPAVSPAGRTNLARLDADVKTLIVLRHANVVPVLEGRWLGTDAFAVVRARVRGSTLDQTLTAIGAMPVLRAKSTLEQVHAALVFARSSGVALRHIAPGTLLFQQGSGRVLVTFDAAPEARSRRNDTDESEDVRTIGRLARVMLSGQLDAGDDRTSLAELRPELPTIVAGAADELRVHGNDDDVLAFFGLLASAVGVPNVTSVISPASSVMAVSPTEPAGAPRRATVARARVGSLPSVPRVATPSTAVPAEQTHGPAASRQTRPRRFGTRARWAIGLGVVLMVLAAGGTLAAWRLGLLTRGMTDTTAAPGGTTTATGDVAKQPTRVAPAVTAPATTAATDSARADTSAVSAGTVAPPVDSSGRVAIPAVVPVAVPPPPNAACASTLPSDQRTCFADAVQRADSDLNRVYAALIAALRHQAKTMPADPDPPVVEKLRSSQRAWLDARDRGCQSVGAGIFSGRDRGLCFTDRAAARTKELQATLDSIPPGA